MLERKKLRSELMRVAAAKAEMDYLIEQKLEEIQRLRDNMAKQDAAEKTIQEKIDSLGE